MVRYKIARHTECQYGMTVCRCGTVMANLADTRSFIFHKPCSHLVLLSNWLLDFHLLLPSLLQHINFHWWQKVEHIIAVWQASFKFMTIIKTCPDLMSSTQFSKVIFPPRCWPQIVGKRLDGNWMVMAYFHKMTGNKQLLVGFTRCYKLPSVILKKRWKFCVQNKWTNVLKENLWWRVAWQWQYRK